MDPFDPLRKSRRNGAEPQPLHLPAPPPADRRRKKEPRVDEGKPAGSHVIVIDIS
jgi:hypothetical protein